VGVRIIPYVFSKRQQKPLFLIPETVLGNTFIKFYPACKPKYGYKIRTETHIKYYPLVLFGVDNEQEGYILIKHLKNLKYKQGKFLPTPIRTTNVKSVGQLIGKFFKKRQAKFLEGLPFNVHVELIDEKGTQYNFITKFEVINETKQIDWYEGKVSDLTDEIENARLNLTQLESLPNNMKLSEAVSEVKKQVIKLQGEKHNLENENEIINSELTTLSGQNKSLGEKLAKTIKLVEMNPEIEKLEKQVRLLENKILVLKGKLGEQLLSNDKHRLIVISLTNRLKSKERIIRDNLIDVFSEFKRTQMKTPFTLLTIQAGRMLNYPLLTDKQVLRGDSITEKLIKGLQFGANDLRALDDLGLLDSIIRERKEQGDSDAIGSILYLTDNTRISSYSKKQHIPNRQRGIPLAWRKDGIALNVLTTEKNKKGKETTGCQVWEYVGAMCTYWDGNKKTLKGELKNFLGLNK
jgi:hypothetical protein